jgi:hypothetical protein
MLCRLNGRRLLWTSYLTSELNVQAECSSLKLQQVVRVVFFMKDLLPRRYVQGVRGQIKSFS